jgi:threonine dehydrogenase-like Zn-dependent dehydrogenase
MPGGAAELISVPAANLHAIPDGLESREAVLAEPGVTALNAVLRLGEVTNRRSLVVGAGTLGLIAAQLLANRGAVVDVLAVEEARLPLIERLGLTPVASAAPHSYECVIEAAGAPEAVRTAVAAVAPGGGISLTGIVSRPMDEFDVTALVLKDATVRGVLNGPGLYPSMLAELANGVVDGAALIEAEYGLEEADLALAELASPSRRAPKVILRIDQQDLPVS